MSTTVNLYSRDGSKLIFSETFSFNMSRGGIYFDANVGIAKLVLSDGSNGGSVSWFPNTSNFAGIAGSANKTTADFTITNSDNITLYYTPVWNVYEAYEGNEAENGYDLTLNTEGGYVLWDANFYVDNVIHNCVTLPDPLPNSVKQTIGGGFLQLVNWYYNSIYTEIAYPNERLNEDTILYAVYEDIGVNINIYDSTGTTLKAVGRYVDTVAALSLYRITDNYELFINANVQDYTIDWSVVEGYELLGLAQEVGGDVWLAMGQTIGSPVATYGTINLYEVVQSIQPPETYSITYVTNGGTLEEDFPNPQTDLQNIPEFLPTCTKVGYVFDGWYLDSSFENPVILGETLTQNISLYAKFTTLLTIDITLYQHKSENNRVDKKPYLTKVMTMRGTFRQSVDILNPIITIEAENLPQFNYVRISSFSRYYFVTSITNINTGLWQIATRCDVLYSYKDTILSQTAFVARNENDYNSLINDDEAMIRITPNINRTWIKSNTKSEWSDTETMMKGDNKIRLLLLTQGQTYTRDDYDWATTQPWGLNSAALTVQGFRGLMALYGNKTISLLSDKLVTELFYSVRVFPFELKTNESITDKVLAVKASTGTPNVLLTYGYPAYAPNSKIIYEHTWEFDIKKPHNITEENYLNYTPYTTIWLQFMPFGRFEIDTKLLFRRGVEYADKLTIIAKTNILKGESQLFYRVGSLASEATIYLGTANVSLELPYSSTAFSNTKVVSGALNAIAGAATFAAGMRGGGAIATSGATNVVSGVGQIANALTSPITALSGGDISIIESAPTIIMESKVLTGVSPSTLGRPLYAERKLYRLTGFTKIVSINLNGFNTATEAEVSAIESQLKSGVIL